MLKSALTHFLLPPGIFIIILIFTSIWLLYKKKMKAGISTFIFGCVAWAISITPVSNAMISVLESGYGIPKNVKGNVIILLGGGVYDKVPDLSGIGVPKDAYLTRIVTAVRLQKRLKIPIIVSGAEGSKYRISEDLIAKRFLIDLGVPNDKIIIENKSRNTFENAKFTQEICERLGFKTFILVTSAYHLKRAVMSFDKVGLEVLPFPAGFMSSHGKHYGWTAYLPGNFLTASIAIREYLGIVFYKCAY